MPPVDGPARFGHEDLADPGDRGMADRLGDEEAAKAPAAGGRVHEYVA